MLIEDLNKTIPKVFMCSWTFPPDGSAGPKLNVGEEREQQTLERRASKHCLQSCRHSKEEKP